MSYNFKHCNREQLFFLPPDIRNWLNDDHLAYFIIDAVGQMDIRPFYRSYREDGRGGQGFEPSMMVCLILYAYSVGERSSRKVERLCEHDVAFRVIAANAKPDHATIARFRKDHCDLFETLFLEILRLCKAAKMLRLGVVALDGTKIGANASLAANRTDASLAAEIKKIFEEAAALDAEEDAKYGPKNRGDEMPKELRDPVSRIARLKECKKRLEEEATLAKTEQQDKIDKRAESEKESGKKKRGRKPRSPEEVVDEEAKANVTDPESRIMKTRSGYIQGYNAQAMATEDQIIIAADVTQEENDLKQARPMIDKSKSVLTSIGVEEKMESCALDAGYFSEAVVNSATDNDPELFIATKKDWKQCKELRSEEVFSEPIPEDLGTKERMAYKLKTERGKTVYAKRKIIIEPIFGQVKSCRRIRDFMMRGLQTAKGEWQLICATHNLLKLFRGQMA
jgi:transposase